MANVGIHSVRGGYLTAAKGCFSASYCWHFETPGAVVDQTTHNKPDLLASTTSCHQQIQTNSREKHHLNPEKTPPITNGDQSTNKAPPPPEA
ncbi:hypothetical protein RHMOL_Rhmol08G0071500 [Rhododendron molle]|uniref:Uncharacterized protein n=1 Tax=Rhododendron molle TaxID=49168 RepID=A0ACC0MKZ8_RHOML|nr:hypothetical protein RHMOL_Rhmol08G0071500 [Rhododendron molle]